MPAQHTLDTGLNFFSKLSHAVYKLLGVRKIVTISYDPNDNVGVERVSYTMAQMLAMLVNELQNYWDEQLPLVGLAHTIRSALSRVWRPTRFIWVAFHASRSRFSNEPGSPATRVWPATTSATEISRPTTSSARTISSVSTMPLQFLAWNAKPRSLRCTAPGSQVRRWRLGVMSDITL